MAVTCKGSGGRKGPRTNFLQRSAHKEVALNGSPMVHWPACCRSCKAEAARAAVNINDRILRSKSPAGGSGLRLAYGISQRGLRYTRGRSNAANNRTRAAASACGNPQADSQNRRVVRFSTPTALGSSPRVSSALANAPAERSRSPVRRKIGIIL